MAGPLLFVSFCTALPAKLGMGVIGGEGALVIGGLVTAAVGVALTDVSYGLTMIGMFLSAFVAGGIWISVIGYLKHYKGANETIVGLLLNYIAIALMNHLVEGTLRDPDSLNKPSTYHIGAHKMIAMIPGTDIHYGIIIGYCYCFADVFSLSFHDIRIFSEDYRREQKGGEAGWLIDWKNYASHFFSGWRNLRPGGYGGVAAVHGRANLSLVVGYGYTGILVSFLARHNPLAIIPVTFFSGRLTPATALFNVAANYRMLPWSCCKELFLLPSSRWSR